HTPTLVKPFSGTYVQRMATEITSTNHPKSIWTWNRTKRGRKVTLYVPYLKAIEKQPGDRWLFRFNGGEFAVNLKDVETILLYGATASLPCEFLDQARKHTIPIIIHRRNMAIPSIFLPGFGCDQDDILTKQILFREDEKKRAYMARTLLRERFRSMERTIPIPARTYRELAQTRNTTAIRLIEARTTKRYWKEWRKQIGASDVGRREDDPLNEALDACSVFASSIVLRWCLYHRLSISHGYLHERTSYPALVYDLIEPYRIWIEDAVAAAFSEVAEPEKDLIPASIEALKKSLEAQIYCHVTRQYCTRAALLHGVVLALRAYLRGDMKRFVVPVEGE
ncbi:CRISPR-associated endonuclease Cas1, partial [Candidatus Parcubacteria bacterium]